MLECTLYISEKLQDCINQVEPAGADMLGSEEYKTNEVNSGAKSIRKHSERIMDLFLKKYVFNAIDLERLTDDDAPDEQMRAAKMSDPSGGQQMRGFELITKVMEHITIMDWLKISRSLHSAQGFHH